MGSCQGSTQRYPTGQGQGAGVDSGGNPKGAEAPGLERRLQCTSKEHTLTKGADLTVEGRRNGPRSQRTAAEASAGLQDAHPGYSLGTTLGQGLKVGAQKRKSGHSTSPFLVSKASKLAEPHRSTSASQRTPTSTRSPAP